MFKPEYFDDFTPFRVWRLRKAKGVHCCCMCGAELTNRKIRLLGSPSGTYEIKQYIFCPSNSCWGEVLKRVNKDDLVTG